jgi:hypothetical protein
MKKHITAIIAYSFLLINIYSCKKQETIKLSEVKPERILTDNITGNRIKIIKLYRDTVYLIQKEFIREAGEQLVIEEGTLIKGANVTIKPGGIILANGTANNPIVFTSFQRPGTRGENSTGIKVEGKSKNNDFGNTGDSTDFSGSLQYCRIEFAPLTLKAVGSRTTIENVMVSYTDRNGLSAYNIIGGTFNAKNLISYACSGPADFYFTNGYTGKMQNLLACRHPFFGSSGTSPVNALAGIFIENNAANPVNARPRTLPIISNLTVIGPNGQNGSTPAYSDTVIRAAAIVTTRNAFFNICNSLFMGFPKAAWVIDDSLTAYSVEKRVALVSNSIFHAGDTSRAFYLKPGSYRPYSNIDFKNYVLVPSVLNNRLLINISDFGLQDIFNYNTPNLLPNANAVVLKGAKFDGVFTAGNPSFFTPTEHLGAFGINNWASGWVNFTPLKTNYNFPE